MELENLIRGGLRARLAENEMTDTTNTLPQLDPINKVQEIHAQIAQLQEQATLLMLEGRNNAIATAMALIAAYGLKPEDIGFPAASEPKAASKPAPRKRPSRANRPPKYRDPDTGATWTGQGAQPRWLDGKNREDYLIRAEASQAAPAAPAPAPAQAQVQTAAQPAAPVAPPAAPFPSYQPQGARSIEQDQLPVC